MTKTLSTTSTTDATPERLPYEKPAVMAEEVFETMALSCAKDGGDFACEPFQSNS